MPNLIKKVLLNVAQVLTAAEKQQERGVIGTPATTSGNTKLLRIT